LITVGTEAELPVSVSIRADESLDVLSLGLTGLKGSST
jgi:hypothetical protein